MTSFGLSRELTWDDAPFGNRQTGLVGLSLPSGLPSSGSHHGDPRVRSVGAVHDEDVAVALHEGGAG